MKIKPKKLNLDKMWRLYLLLKPVIDDRNQEEILLDEIDKIIELSTPQALLESIHIMYDNDIEFCNMIEFSVLFMIALRENGFFDFVNVIRGLNGFYR
jgi:hypothetical protein